jgi:hypothetical protein
LKIILYSIFLLIIFSSCKDKTPKNIYTVIRDYYFKNPKPDTLSGNIKSIIEYETSVLDTSLSKTTNHKNKKEKSKLYRFDKRGNQTLYKNTESNLPWCSHRYMKYDSKDRMILDSIDKDNYNIYIYIY